jgi:hypothetical protein
VSLVLGVSESKQSVYDGSVWFTTFGTVQFPVLRLSPDTSLLLSREVIDLCHLALHEYQPLHPDELASGWLHDLHRKVFPLVTGKPEKRL